MSYTMQTIFSDGSSSDYRTGTLSDRGSVQFYKQTYLTDRRRVHGISEHMKRHPSTVDKVFYGRLKSYKLQKTSSSSSLKKSALLERLKLGYTSSREVLMMLLLVLASKHANHLHSNCHSILKKQFGAQLTVSKSAPAASTVNMSDQFIRSLPILQLS